MIAHQDLSTCFIDTGLGVCTQVKNSSTLRQRLNKLAISCIQIQLSPRTNRVLRLLSNTCSNLQNARAKKTKVSDNVCLLEYDSFPIGFRYAWLPLLHRQWCRRIWNNRLHDHPASRNPKEYSSLQIRHTLALYGIAWNSRTKNPKTRTNVCFRKWWYT